MQIDISSLSNTVVSLFLIMLTGIIAYKLGYMDKQFSKKLSTFVICVAQPFMIISGLQNVEYSYEKLKLGGVVLMIAAGIYTVSAIIGYFATAYYKDFNEKKISEFGIVFANTGFMGFPVLKAMFGENGSFYASFYIIAFNLFIWTYGISILSRKSPDIHLNLRKIFINFGTIPCAIGIILYILKPYFTLPIAVVSSMNSIGNLCTPLAMFIIGGLIATIPIKNLFGDIKVYYLCLIKLLALPLISSLVARLIGLSNEFVLFCAIMTALPCASNSAMYAEKYDIAPAYAAKNVGISTLLSVVTVPLIIFLVDML